MAGEIGLLLGVGQGLVAFTYTLGPVIQTLPIPSRRIKAWAPTLMMDAVISQFALLSVSLVQILVNWVSNLASTSVGSPFNSSTVAVVTILAQLISLDVAFIILISVLSATVVLSPVAYALSSILNPAMTWITIAIVLWLIIQLTISYLPQVWLSAYILGVLFMAIPFRIGRRFGTLLMASSITFSIGLPPAPSLAIWLEGYVGYQTALAPLQQMISQIQRNPLLVGQFLASLPQALGGLLAAVVIALVVFPTAYLFVLSMITRSLANVLGGAAEGPLLSEQMIGSSRELGSTIARGVGE